MATKGIAVSQIVLLVLGILVLAVVAYLLYTQFVTTGGTIGAETCRAEATRICTGCQIAGIALQSCTYEPTVKDSDGDDVASSIAKCVQQGKVVGTSNSIDCTRVIGIGSIP